MSTRGSKDKDRKWIQTMKDEINSLKKNSTWEHCMFPEDRTAIGCKWFYKIKTDAEGKDNRSEARLVAQNFSQKFDIDYSSTSKTTFEYYFQLLQRKILLFMMQRHHF